MDGSLLQIFADSVRSRLVGRSVGVVRWYPPILSIPVGDRTQSEFLVAIVGHPGPFCYLAPAGPLEKVAASQSFRPLTGAHLLDVRRPTGERILRVAAESSDETGDTLRLDLLLFGSTGRAELLREGDVLIQAVGGRGRPQRQRLESAPAPATPATPLVQQRDAEGLSEFYLTSKSRLCGVGVSAADDPRAGHRLGPFRDAVEACHEVGVRLLDEAYGAIVRSRLKPVARRADSLRRLLVKLEADLESATGGWRVRREAETLATYQSRIPSGSREIELPDPYDPETTHRIELDPSVPVRAQIDKRFKRAARLERSVTPIEQRIDTARRDLLSLESRMSSVESEADFAVAMGKLDELLDRLPGSRTASTTGGRGRAERNEATSYRRFDLDKMWFVLVGRNNRENDDLTFHTAAPSDLWFHAQYVPGSHVVLKSRGKSGAPPAGILERAASIAAYFSKAKHSGLVPVIYTQRKYVRKPRGAKPGQVTCEREQMVLVEPVLPETDS